VLNFLTSIWKISFSTRESIFPENFLFIAHYEIAFLNILSLKSPMLILWFIFFPDLILTEANLSIIDKLLIPIKLALVFDLSTFSLYLTNHQLKSLTG